MAIVNQSLRSNFRLGEMNAVGWTVAATTPGAINLPRPYCMSVDIVRPWNLLRVLEAIIKSNFERNGDAETNHHAYRLAPGEELLDIGREAFRLGTTHDGGRPEPWQRLYRRPNQPMEPSFLQRLANVQRHGTASPGRHFLHSGNVRGTDLRLCPLP